MSRIIYWVVGFWLVVAIFLIGKETKAETRTYQSPNGQVTGYSYTMGNMTFYQDKSGKPVGSSTTMDSYTFYSAPDGKVLGSSYTMPSSNQQPQPNPFFGEQDDKRSDSFRRTR